jgi:Na+/melibiose symporter-like transporter
MKMVLKQKLFVVFITAYTLYRGLVLTMQASLPYLVTNVLLESTSVISLLSIAFLVGALISAPLWIKLAHKTNNNKKVLISAAILLTGATVPLIFIESTLVLFFILIIWGAGLGGFWALLAPILADVIDESVATTGKREEGIYSGVQAFFGRIAIILQSLTIALAHVATGYNPATKVQTGIAVFGIHVHFGLIPMIFILLATIIFWKWYDLTPEKVEINQLRIEELGL